MTNQYAYNNKIGAFLVAMFSINVRQLSLFKIILIPSFPWGGWDINASSSREENLLNIRLCPFLIS